MKSRKSDKPKYNTSHAGYGMSVNNLSLTPFDAALDATPADVLEAAFANDEGDLTADEAALRESLVKDGLFDA